MVDPFLNQPSPESAATRWSCHFFKARLELQIGMENLKSLGLIFGPHMLWQKEKYLENTHKLGSEQQDGGKIWKWLVDLLYTRNAMINCLIDWFSSIFFHPVLFVNIFLFVRADRNWISLRCGRGLVAALLHSLTKPTMVIYLVVGKMLTFSSQLARRQVSSYCILHDHMTVFSMEHTVWTLNFIHQYKRACQHSKCLQDIESLQRSFRSCLSCLVSFKQQFKSNQVSFTII